MSDRARPSAVVLALGLALGAILAACTGSAAPAAPVAPETAAGSPASAGTGLASPAAPGVNSSRDFDFIDHPSGSTDVVLRVAEEGGFMMMESVMARVPLFSMYGDGRVVLVAPEAAAKGQAGASGMPAQVLRETRLSEDQVQAVLRSALVDGKLGIAKQEFPVMVMDVPTTVIEIHAGGVEKRIKAAGLSLEPVPGPDEPVLRAMAELVDRLRSIPTVADYAPEASGAVLAETEPAPGTATIPWPWPDVPPAGFAKPAADDPFGFTSHALTASESEAVGITPGSTPAPLTLKGPDGRTYVVVVRPALPDEAASR